MYVNFHEQKFRKSETPSEIFYVTSEFASSL